jgi:hypothetical protein
MAQRLSLLDFRILGRCLGGNRTQEQVNIASADGGRKQTTPH